MFKLIQRYLAATFIPPFLIGTTFFISFLLTFQLFKVIPLLSDKTVSVALVFELIMHISVSFVPIAVPVAALFATIFTLSKLSEDSEIVAMRSFGITKFRILLPFLLVGSVIAIAVFSLNQTLIPRSKTKFKQIIMKLSSKGALSNITPGTFYTEIPGVVLFAKKVGKNGLIMNDLFITQKTARGERTIMAKRGALIKQSRGEWSVPTIRLHLNDGNVVTSSSSGDVEKIIFSEYDFPVMSPSGTLSMGTKDSMRSSTELLKIISEKQDIVDAERAKASPNKKIIKDYLGSIAKSNIEYWTRLNTPIQTMAFIFLGLCLGIKRRRGKSQNNTGVGMVVLFSYYLIFFIGLSLAKKVLIPSVLVVIIPTVVIFFVSLLLYRKLDWAS